MSLNRPQPPLISGKEGLNPIRYPKGWWPTTTPHYPAKRVATTQRGGDGPPFLFLSYPQQKRRQP